MSTSAPLRRPGVRFGAVVVAALVVFALWAGRATAGGPTSVLLASPDHEKTASLYTSQPRYQQLESLVRGGVPRQQPSDAAAGSYITVTWLIHDVRVWRVDRIFPAAPGGLLVATQDVMNNTEGPASTADAGPGPALPVPAVWHEPTDARQLLGLLKALGLMKETTPPPAAAPVESAVATTSKTPAAARPAVGTGWWWALPGTALGALLGASGVRLARRHSRPATPPRQELLDA